MAGLNSAAYKLLISDIVKAKEVENSVIRVDLSSEEFKTRATSQDPVTKKTLIVNVAWIQGDITDIRPDPGDSSNKLLVINDGSGDAVITGWNVIPGGDHEDIKKGVYIGILGQVLTTEPRVYLKAVKIMVLNKNPVLKAMWRDEVKDLKAYLLGLYANWAS